MVECAGVSGLVCKFRNFPTKMLTVGADFVDGLIQLEVIIVLTPKERYKKESRRGPALEYPFVLTCKRLRFKKRRGSSSYFVSLDVHLK